MRQQVACFESHRKAWARIVEEDWRQAIIMEDDAEVDLSEHMSKVAQFVADAPPDWQLLYLGINNANVSARAPCPDHAGDRLVASAWVLGRHVEQAHGCATCSCA